MVWVGLDDNQPLGLSGSQAALPIWTAFMKKALAGRTATTFEAPDGVSFVEIDRDTGKIATPTCPRVTNEAFLAGTEPLGSASCIDFSDGARHPPLTGVPGTVSHRILSP